MKINHKLIRTILSTVSITIFILSVFFKFRSILLYGGTRHAPLPNENENEQELKESELPTAVMEADDDDDDDDDDDYDDDCKEVCQETAR